MKVLSQVCRDCGECCKFMVLPVISSMNKSIMESWIKARGCEVLKDAGSTIYVKINVPCPHLNKSENSFSCSIYADRPEGCRLFDGRNYDFLKCAWNQLPKFVILEKSIKGFIGARKFIGRSERKRMAKRASRERKEEKAEDIKLYGSSLESD
jgi:Fe-S-cluster containining protein